jgi:hypothetical protein
MKKFTVWTSAGEFQEIGEGRPGRPGVTGQAVLSRFAIVEAEVLTHATRASP